MHRLPVRGHGAMRPQHRGDTVPLRQSPCEGDLLEAKLIFRAASLLLALAFTSGLAMALIRFATDRPSPPWVAKVHGFAAAGALTLLIFGWAHAALPRAGLYGLLTLLVAAAGGLVLNLGYHWRQKPLPEWLVFAHLSVAFIGFVVVGVVGLSMTQDLRPITSGLGCLSPKSQQC